MQRIQNFGRNVDFHPRHHYVPQTRDELLEILDQHRDGKIRVVASKHAWSNAIVSHDAIVDMRHFDSIEIEKGPDYNRVRVGAGCQIKHLLKALNAKGLTLPSVGLITEQTVAGATATGTHGSGKNSLSHYVTEAEVACYSSHDVSPRLVAIDEGDELLAIRCSLGCLGVVVSLTFECVPQYNILENIWNCASVDEALTSEPDEPLQQFYLFPYQWRVTVHQRRETSKPRSKLAPLYRVYWLFNLDLVFHFIVKLLSNWLPSRILLRFFYLRVLPIFILSNWKVSDRSDRQLVMEHELFRHLELEVFISNKLISKAAEFVQFVLRYAEGEEIAIPDWVNEELSRLDLLDQLHSIKGVFSTHYLIAFRRILCDETLISMTSPRADEREADWYYSLSFITYVEPRDEFLKLAEFLARSLDALFGARFHWGKWAPFERLDVTKSYAGIEKFRAIANRFDPNGVFRNEYVENALFRESP